ncbi:hypothetical protein AAJ72_10045 [Citromicrobium sp. RCC1885]|nr:hypothetical protein AAJ72_10045 [Citromicrobium sp. RCC1885]KPM26642.1 hypothetical protein AAJ74_10785 [Citromicrobium sp. RCC1878]OAM08840.1 hypothetical protein A0U43_09520 [Citromicrobium sp. RCC1897]|tara:strand:- start:2310 stop:2960 length:651 start_codon:yes stop_codon:yes gene_type:complete
MRSPAEANLSDTWIRTKQVQKLIAEECNGDHDVMNGRMRTAFAAGAIRCEAGIAIIQRGASEERLPDWPVPRWAWQLSQGKLSLAEDRYVAPIDEDENVEIFVPSNFQNVWDIDLLQLKIHEPDLFKHFQLEVIPEPKSPRKTTVYKQTVIKDCVAWFKEQFANDPECKKLRDELKEEARAHFGEDRLSGYGATQAWRDAVKEHPERSKQGRRAGS